MLRQALSALVLFVAIAALPSGSFAKDLVAGSKINRDGGYDFSIDGLGNMNLASIKVDGKASDTCLVDLDSVKTLIQEDVRSKSLKYEPSGANGIVVVITLESKVCDTVVCCGSRGTGCTAAVVIKDKKKVLDMLQ